MPIRTPKVNPLLSPLVCGESVWVHARERAARAGSASGQRVRRGAAGTRRRLCAVGGVAGVRVGPPPPNGAIILIVTLRKVYAHIVLVQQLRRFHADLIQPWTSHRIGLSLLRHTLAGIERCGGQVQRCAAQCEASPRPPLVS